MNTLAFDMKACPPPVRIASPEVNHSSTAVILIDLQNELAKPGGKLYDYVSGTMEKNDMMNKVSSMVSAAHENGALIVYSTFFQEEDEKLDIEDYDHSPEMSSHKDLFAKGTWNSEIVDELLRLSNEKQQADNIICVERKHRSAFHGTNLEHTLRAKGIDTVFLMGFTSEVCIFETAIDALNIFGDIHVFVCNDGCATRDASVHDKVMQTSLPCFGVHVISCSDAKGLLQKESKKLDSADEEGKREGKNRVEMKRKVTTFAPVTERDSSLYATEFSGPGRKTIALVGEQERNILNDSDLQKVEWTTREIEGVLRKGVYQLSSLISFPEIGKPVPRYAKLPVKEADWCKGEGTDSGVLYFSAEAISTTIPVEMATSILLEFYDCTIISPNSSELIELFDEHTMQDLHYHQDYFNLYAKGQAGLERHSFAHVGCPLDTLDESGNFVIGKFSDDGQSLFLTAFRIPQLHVLYVPGEIIHTNDYLCGTWRTMLPWTSQVCSMNTCFWSFEIFWSIFCCFFKKEPIDHVKIVDDTKEKASLTLEGRECRKDDDHSYNDFLAFLNS